MTVTHRLRTGRGYSLSIRLQRTRSSQGKPVIVICHGLGVSSRYPLIATLTKEFRSAGYPVCTFDLAGHGESGGRINDRLVQNFIKDLGDVCAFVRSVHGDERPIVIVGHSIGALSAILYAGAHAKDNLILVPIAANAHAHRKYEAMLKQGTVRELKRYTLVGRSKVSKRFWKDRIHFEPKRFVSRLGLPVLYLCGTMDHTNPPEESRALYRWTLSGRKALRLINGADHHFRPLSHRLATAHIIRTWLQRTL